MTHEQYQTEVQALASLDKDVPSWLLGLAGEAGEVCDLFKKARRTQTMPPRAQVLEELGDVTWYVQALCTEFGITYDELTDFNVAKLRRRHKR